MNAKTLSFISGIFLSVLAETAELAGIDPPNESRAMTRRRGVAHIVIILLVIIIVLLVLIFLTI